MAFLCHSGLLKSIKKYLLFVTLAVFQSFNWKKKIFFLHFPYIPPSEKDSVKTGQTKRNVTAERHDLKSA